MRLPVSPPGRAGKLPKRIHQFTVRRPSRKPRVCPSWASFSASGEWLVHFVCGDAKIAFAYDVVSVEHRALRSHIFEAPYYSENFRFLQNAVGFFGCEQDGLYEFMARLDSPL